MRLKRISLFAVLSLAVAGGCSASRNSITPLRDRDDQTVLPPRHDHEYSPGTESSDDFQDPPQRSGPKEPVPAPPAFGVSRVKSVGWIKDLGAKLHRKPLADSGECSDDLSCSDQELVGKCSALDPCVTETEFLAESPEACCEERACDSAPPRRISRFKRFHRSLPGAFPNEAPHAYKPECSPMLTESDICGPPRQFAPQACQEPCGEKTIESGCADLGCSAVEKSAPLHSPRKRDCLADPLRDTVLNGADPGLITPSDIHVGPGEGVVIPEQIPVVPSVPGGEFVPQLDLSVPSQTVPGLPQPQAIPATPGSSSRIVEPPVWPGLKNKSGVTSVSRSKVMRNSGEMRISGDLPTVTPAAKK